MARARVPSHFSSKMWSFESNGVSRLSASIGLITWRYGSNGAIRSTGLRGLEACLQRGHEILRGLRLDLGDRRQFLALDLRLDELEREVDLRVGDHDGSGCARLGRRLPLALVHPRREDEAPLAGPDPAA